MDEPEPSRYAKEMHRVVAFFEEVCTTEEDCAFYLGPNKHVLLRALQSEEISEALKERIRALLHRIHA